jgi:hypothetical protein
MANKDFIHSGKDVFSNQTTSVFHPQTHGERRQDNARISSARGGTRQPDTETKFTRAEALDSSRTRSANENVQKSRTEKLTSWVSPRVKAGFQRIAAQEGLSLSATIAAFLERDLQAHVDMHYSATLPPIIEHAIRKEMQGMRSSQAWLLTRNVFAGEHTRHLVTNILGLLCRQQKLPEETLKTIIAQTKQTAAGNLRRRNPELEELIASLKKWLEDEEEKPNTEGQRV